MTYSTIETVWLAPGTEIAYLKGGVKVVETVETGVEVGLVNFTSELFVSLVKWPASPSGEAFATEPMTNLDFQI